MRILITSALPYANGPLHFGHIAGAYLPADAYARFARLMGHEVLYICGSDEYGIAITLSAELVKRTPKQQVDYYHTLHKDLFAKLEISFDHFSRTTSEIHTETVQDFFQDLYDEGFIEKKEEEHLYSEEEMRFLADRYVVGTCPKCRYEKARGDECPECGSYFEAKELGNPISKLTGSSLSMKKSVHWYLRFDLFKEKLHDWLEKKSWKPNVLHFVQNYLKELQPRAITRDSSWGIPVPLQEAEGKVFYVWFDAPIGYISATKEWAKNQGNPEEWKKFWKEKETKHVEFIGKDNIPFHALFFPAMLMGQKSFYKTVDDLPANEFLLLEGKQFSKSDNWYIDLDRFFSKYSTDQIRYVLSSNAPESQDAEFSWKDFQKRCNAELLGKWGNFVHRTLTFAHKFTQGKVPFVANLLPIDQDFLQSIKEKVMQIASDYERYSLRRASEGIMHLASLGNGYFDQKKPWQANKEGNQEEVDRTIYCSLECIKLLSIVSYPIIPHAATKAFSFLGGDKALTDLTWRDWIKKALDSQQMLNKPEILFRKIEDEEIEAELMRLGSLLSQS